VGGLREHDNGTNDSNKGGEILEELSDSYLLEKSNVLFILQKMYTMYCLFYISCDTIRLDPQIQKIVICFKNYFVT
jgi:hypothetical protein